MKDIQERCLLAVLNDYLKKNSELLQCSACFSIVSMETQRLCAIAYKVFKTLSDLNPNIMKEIFYCTPNLTYRKSNLYVNSQSTTKFRNKG